MSLFVLLCASNVLLLFSLPFKGEDPAFVSNLVSRLEPLCIYPGEMVLEEGDVATEFYFLLQVCCCSLVCLSSHKVHYLQGEVEAFRAGILHGFDLTVAMYDNGR